MKIVQLIVVTFLFVACSDNKMSNSNSDKQEEQKIKSENNKPEIGSPRLVIHGGAGSILPENLTIEQRKAYEDKLTEALSAGYMILNENGSSSEAVIKAIQILEI